MGYGDRGNQERSLPWPWIWPGMDLPARHRQRRACSQRLHDGLDRVGIRRPRTVARGDLSICFQGSISVQGFGISNVRLAAACMEVRSLHGELRLGDAVLGKAANDHPVDRDRGHWLLREESSAGGHTKYICGAVRSFP